ncbi:DNA alkylation repair protein [Nocardioides sp. C4-1]|uniref:DNA alkylation repair protein n=1 Tax=Nocardioides sp. C4-1 TaxID=3151851 RepID=UPI003264DF2C
MAADVDFVHEVRATLAASGDPGRAARQQAYMKSALPFHGLSAPQLTVALQPLLAVDAPADRAVHEATVRRLWDDATHREEWYAAIALMRLRRLRSWLDPEALPLLRHLVVTGAWWDVVDDVATHPVADVLTGHRGDVTATMRAWAVDDDPWVRRTAVLCQVGARDATDRDLLRHAIEANAADPTNWLRKAIGWALRDYARTDPVWVRAEVDRLGERLSGLSRREALKRM